MWDSDAQILNAPEWLLDPDVIGEDSTNASTPPQLPRSGATIESGKPGSAS
jgi:hypothetical protein